MINRRVLFFLCFLVISFSCSKKDEGSMEFESASSAPNEGGGKEAKSGVVTAAEWNDLNNWAFWEELLTNQEHTNHSVYWSTYTNHRVAVKVENEGAPIANVSVELLRNNQVVWEAKTDNLGKAELWSSSFQYEEDVFAEQLSLKVDGIEQQQSVSIGEEVNVIQRLGNSTELNKVEIAFIVDATGSMSDEIAFLKEDLKSVIEQVKKDIDNVDISTGAVFYRDEGDAYLTRKTAFSSDLSVTQSFIDEQKAGGGGDFPEAVHAALNEGVNELQWSENVKTRIAFLMLDAPPHHSNDVIEDLQTSIKEAARRGIKVIPITASGIDKETEFLMRFMAVLTNGTYVFITNDSGVGNDHIEASVGEYQVEYLNELMVRLIEKYSK